MSRADLIKLGNEMQRYSWQRYHETLDERHVERAEWWRAQTERAVARAAAERRVTI